MNAIQRTELLERCAKWLAAQSLYKHPAEATLEERLEAFVKGEIEREIHPKIYPSWRTDCPCWNTGVFIRVLGCTYHLWEL